MIWIQLIVLWEPWNIRQFWLPYLNPWKEHRLLNQPGDRSTALFCRKSRNFTCFRFRFLLRLARVSSHTWITAQTRVIGRLTARWLKSVSSDASFSISSRIRRCGKWLSSFKCVNFCRGPFLKKLHYDFLHYDYVANMVTEIESGFFPPLVFFLGLHKFQWLGLGPSQFKS